MTPRTISLVLTAAAVVAAQTYTPAERRHWAFQKRATPEPPRVAGATNPIDAFLLARLGKEGLHFAPPASRETLIRRVYFDVLGLPPAPAEIDAFLSDRAPNAWEKLADRLLASPHYGERWAQHWLDVVRFAESDGFEYDTHRPDAWRYRDYVIASFNQDKPYDRFLTDQLAGDEMSPDNHEARIAAGFQRLGPLRKNAGNQEVASSRNEVLTEMTNIVGSALLGVTLGCARCHDHKFDPIRQKDYYRMQAYFAAVHEKDVPLASAEEQAAWKTRKDSIEREVRELRKTMKGLQGEDLARMEKQVRQVEESVPEPLPALYSVVNDNSRATPIHVLARGDYQNKGEPAGMRPLGVLLPEDAPELPAGTPNPRTRLAAWLAHPDQPLTARVFVNRVWQRHFGRGLVATPNDFGRMGARPSHPELLDWLANEFVRGGWRVKAVDRLILTSQAYRQSWADPDSALLSHFPRRRLEGEEIRDAILAVAGRLNLKAGGPSVIVPVDQELIGLLYKPSQWAVARDENEHDRRGIYLLHKRNLRLPLLEVFDAPDAQISCARRESSTHAPQALELMNGSFARQMAAALAARLDREAAGGPRRQVELAYRLAAGRSPTPKEMAPALEFLRTQPLREFALAVFNLNAFLYVN